MKNDFNLIAPIYDRLAKLIFGDSLDKSQLEALHHINKGDHILILGGGSGSILRALNQLGINLTITYIELSSKMIQKADARLPLKNLEVNFVNNDALEVRLPKADVVITNYFLDVFTKLNLATIMMKIDQALVPSGIWLCTDFKKTNSILKNGLIKSMYLFFKIISQLETSQLQDFEKEFEGLGYKKNTSKLYFGNMIESATYIKS